MDEKKLEIFVKILPRDKYDYGFCHMTNRDTPAQQNAYNKIAAENIADDIRAHKTSEMGTIEVCDDEYELQLEEQNQLMRSFIDDFMKLIKNKDKDNFFSDLDDLISKAKEIQETLNKRA